jgi:hypothetical protein
MKYMSIKSLFALSAIALASAAAPATAASLNLIQNGSFEEFAVCAHKPCTTVLGSGSYLTLFDGQLKGWEAGDKGVELRNNLAGVAQSGKYFVELDTTKNSSISQKVNITSAGSYLLSFWYAARPDNGNLSVGTDQIGWSFGEGEAASGTVLKSYKTDGATTWTQFSQVFTFKKAGNVELEFDAKGASDSFGGSLDNVSLVSMVMSPSITPAVPEPESYAMLIAGLGLMAAISRRRKQRKA